MDEWEDRPSDPVLHPEPSAAAGSPSNGDADSGDEGAVRRYLEFLEDPSSARDEALVAELEANVAAATDPIEKIHLASDLHRARQVDGDELRRAFVAVARRWAEEHGVVTEAFRTLGVPDADLRAAGFEVPRVAGRRAEVGTEPAGRAPGRRAPRATIDDVRAAARSFDGPFTIADLRDRAGGSPATARKALDAMVAEGTVEALGPTPGWAGPGRPPLRFVLRSASG